MVTAALLPLHRELQASSRLAAWSPAADRARVGELGILILAGMAAALSAAGLEFSLRIPGHAILRSVFPMALGLALAPRRMGGTVMGCSAAATSLGLRTAAGWGLGLGAFTSLCLIGPLLDVALWRAQRGWRLYVAFAAAGWAANLGAFAVRGAGKAFAWNQAGIRPWVDWLSVAPWTYSLCGLVAGLVSAAVWFRLRTGPGGDHRGDRSS